MRPLLLRLSKRYRFLRIARHYYLLVRNMGRRARQLTWPVLPRTVLFQAYGGVYACSPKAMYEYMLYDERFTDYRFIWVVSDPQKYADLAANPRTTLVAVKTPAYYRAFAQAQYWIVNIMLPLRITKRKSQTMVQCWHGTPLKRLRNDVIENTQNAMNTHRDFVRKNRVDVRRYDVLLSPSRFASTVFASAFGLESPQERRKIAEVGYPRNDALHVKHSAADIAKRKKALGLLPDKKVLLYAPTWRDDQHDSSVGYTHQNMLDFTRLRRELGDDFVVLFRAHYMVASRFDFARYQGFVIDVSQVDDVNDLYVVSDALITDYSSVMFDFANLGRPIFFYMYDLAHYEQDLRGFYLNLAELPGEIATTQAQLMHLLADIPAYARQHRKKYAAFRRTFTYLDDGHASARLVEHVFGLSPP